MTEMSPINFLWGKHGGNSLTLKRRGSCMKTLCKDQQQKITPG